MVNRGVAAKDIKAILEEDALDASIYIMVDTLKYLKKGGRVTPAAAMIGTVLNIKPVLTIQGEKLDAFEKARGVKQAKKAMIKAMKKIWTNASQKSVQPASWDFTLPIPQTTKK